MEEIIKSLFRQERFRELAFLLDINIFTEKSDNRCVINRIYKNNCVEISLNGYYCCKNCPSKFRDKPEGCERNLGVVTLKGEHCGGSDDEAAKCDTGLNDFFNYHQIKVICVFQEPISNKFVQKELLKKLYKEVITRYLPKDFMML